MEWLEIFSDRSMMSFYVLYSTHVTLFLTFGVSSVLWKMLHALYIICSLYCSFHHSWLSFAFISVPHCNWKLFWRCTINLGTACSFWHQWCTVPIVFLFHSSADPDYFSCLCNVCVSCLVNPLVTISSSSSAGFICFPPQSFFCPHLLLVWTPSWSPPLPLVGILSWSLHVIDGMSLLWFTMTGALQSIGTWLCIYFLSNTTVLEKTYRTVNGRMGSLQ